MSTPTVVLIAIIMLTNLLCASVPALRRWFWAAMAVTAVGADLVLLAWWAVTRS